MREQGKNKGAREKETEMGSSEMECPACGPAGELITASEWRTADGKVWRDADGLDRLRVAVICLGCGYSGMSHDFPNGRIFGRDHPDDCRCGCCI